MLCGLVQASGVHLERYYNHSLRKVVKVRGLVKEFRRVFTDSVTAVNNVDIDIFENQITVLLGHNGAGKTTTMSMICGLIQPTAGTIAVEHEYNVTAYRHKIGFCPQHNIIFPFLTCKEHLYFFARVKLLEFLNHMNLDKHLYCIILSFADYRKERHG